MCCRFSCPEQERDEEEDMDTEEQVAKATTSSHQMLSLSTGMHTLILSHCLSWSLMQIQLPRAEEDEEEDMETEQQVAQATTSSHQVGELWLLCLDNLSSLVA